MSYVESVGIPGFVGLTGAKTAYKDENILLGEAQAINFTGAGVAATLNAGVLTVEVEGGGSSINVVDGLTSTSATDALSANQGKVLNVRLGTIEGNQSNYLTTSTASSTYQTQSGMSNYLTTSTASSTYATVANQRYTFVSDSNTTYTVPASAVTENGRTIIELSNNSLTSITINAATGTGKTAGDSVNISITGTYAAQVLAAGAGVTLQGDLTFSYQYQTKTLVYKGSNVWKVVG